MSLNIVFAGTPDFAATIAATLDPVYKISAIYTQPDRPSGRGRKLSPSPLKAFAQKTNKAFYQPLNFKTLDAIASLEALKPDLIVVAAYGLILPESVLQIPRYGCINVHASLLPAWRGASPIQQALLHGDQITGITIMQMDKGLDTGNILLVRQCPITSTDNSASLTAKLASLGAEALIATLDLLVNNQLSSIPQPLEGISHAPKINKVSAKINWHQSAIEIDRLIRAYNPWPVAFTELRGQTLRIWRADVHDHMAVNAKPGTLISSSPDELLVATGKGSLQLLEVQYPNQKKTIHA